MLGSVARARANVRVPSSGSSPSRTFPTPSSALFWKGGGGGGAYYDCALALLNLSRGCTSPGQERRQRTARNPAGRTRAENPEQQQQQDKVDERTNERTEAVNTTRALPSSPDPLLLVSSPGTQRQLAGWMVKWRR